MVTGIGKELDLAPLTSIDQHAREEIGGFVDPGLRRINLTFDDLDLPERLAAMAQRAWTSLDELASSPEAPETLASLDDLREAYESYYLESEAVTQTSLIVAREEGHRRGVLESPITGRTALLALAVSAARRLPRWVRRLVPASLRARVRTRLGSRRVG